MLTAPPLADDFTWMHVDTSVDPTNVLSVDLRLGLNPHWEQTKLP